MQLNIKITPNTDLDTVLKRLETFDKKVRGYKNFKRRNDLGQIRLRKRMKRNNPKRKIYVPVMQPDGTYNLYPNAKEQVVIAKVNKARLQLYKQMLINNTFRHPSWTWRKIKVFTNKQFKEEFHMEEYEMATLQRNEMSLEDELKKIGLGRDDIAAMIKEDLVSRKGNRDRLLQIVIDMWNRIDDAKATKETEETKKVIDMMKKVIDAKPTKDSPKMLEGEVIKELKQEDNVKEYKESIDINKLNEAVGLEKTE